MSGVNTQDYKRRFKYGPQAVRNEDGSLDRKASIKENRIAIEDAWNTSDWDIYPDLWASVFMEPEDGGTALVGLAFFGWFALAELAARSLLYCPLKALVSTLKDAGDIGWHTAAEGFASVTTSKERLFTEHK